MFLQPQWPAPASIKAYTTLRSGGFSQPPYHEFNLALHVEDQAEQVLANRKKLREIVACPSEPLWLQQIHSTLAVEALAENANREADASFTHQPQQVCTILTADCLPILLCNRQGNAVAALHAGWRGLAQGIIEKTLQGLKQPSQELLAWLGPAISQPHYEVGEEVYTSFCSQNPLNKTAFIQTKPTHWQADLYELARIQLRALGISAIYGGDYCTFSQEKYFFSHRRDKGRTGRMASLIWIA